MSRIAKNPVVLPAGVEAKLEAGKLSVKGGKGTLNLSVHPEVEVRQEEGSLLFSPRSGSKHANAMAGTLRSLAQNMVQGVSQGFERKLELVGVGYRAKAAGQTLSLTLGLSHPLDYQLPEGITVETPSQTEIVLKGADKQQIGQVAAEIRAFRAPEPYKGKGIRYAGEQVRRKEAKKK